MTDCTPAVAVTEVGAPGVTDGGRGGRGGGVTGGDQRATRPAVTVPAVWKLPPNIALSLPMA